MNKAMIKKLIIEAYLSGAESMYCGCYERPTKAEARDWYDQEYGVEDAEITEDCDCCEEEED
jgi:hypothetical protein